MIVTIILGLFSILFAYLSKHKNTQWGLKVSFALIFLFLALRYNFGNDYEGYLEGFIRIGQYDQVNFNDFALLYEPGWVLLNWLFKPIGFFAMTAVLALASCVVYYRFVARYVPVKYYWLAIFMYVFYPDFMLVHSSAMRQSIAIMLFVLSLDYLYKREALRYFLCIGLAALFHFTAIILAPIYLLTYLNHKITKIYGVIFVSIFIFLFLAGESLTPYFKLIISSFSEKYEFYQDAGIVNSGFGFLYYLALFILILYFERLQNREVALVFKIAIFSFLFMPLTLIIEMISRLGMYFAPATIIAYPNIFKSIKKPICKTAFIAILISVTIYQFYQFFHSDTYKEFFGIYQTILSAPQWY
jgi:hypothetical protein